MQLSPEYQRRGHHDIQRHRAARAEENVLQCSEADSNYQSLRGDPMVICIGNEMISTA
jgi:hypothetical protein